MKRADKGLRDRRRRWLPTPSIVLAIAALFVVLGGSAIAANGLIQAGDIATGAVFLCSDEANFFTGVCLEVDGGRCI